MYKFLIILGLIVYVIYKLGSLFFRAGAASQQFRNPQQRNFDGHVDQSAQKAKKKGNDFKGGEYVDYEEIK
jgi:hypothetical protein